MKCCTQEIRTRVERDNQGDDHGRHHDLYPGVAAGRVGRVAHNYHPLDVVVATGAGAVLTDVDGTEYLDFLAAYSATNLGTGTRRWSPPPVDSWTGSH